MNQKIAFCKEETKNSETVLVREIRNLRDVVVFNKKQKVDNRKRGIEKMLDIKNHK